MVVTIKPTREQVMREIFKDIVVDGVFSDDNVHWVLFEHGTFYTFPKSETQKADGDDLVAQALQMSQDAHLLKYDDNDSVTVLPYNDLWSHPTYLVLSCLRQHIGWIVVAESPEWAHTEQQQAAVGYYARTMYEMDCHENKVVATSFAWSAA